MNSQASFPYTGRPIFFDSVLTGEESLTVVSRNLVKALRDISVPAFGLHYNKNAQEFWTGRHLCLNFPPFADLSPFEYVYTEAGLSSRKDLIPDSAQSITITVIDDFRWKLRHIQHGWKGIDTILTFSKFSQMRMKEALKREIGYFPLGVDTKVFHPIDSVTLPSFADEDILYKNFPYPPKDIFHHTYIFLSVGFMQERKGIVDLLTAYHKAFYGQAEVLLWIHGPKGSWSDDGIHKYLQLFNNDQAPLVLWTTKRVTNTELNNILNLADCYVSPHHLEGFGLGPLQALACQRPIISTAFSGPMDYLPRKGVTFIPCKESRKKLPHEIGYVPWGEYEESDLIDALRSKPIAKPVLQGDWSWGRSAREFVKYVKSPGKIQGIVQGVTVLIPCWKDAANLRTLLHSLKTIPPGIPHKVIVGNDGSSDDVSAVCREYADVEEVRTPADNTGLGKIRNLLISHAKTEYVVFFDCDIEIVTPHWLSEWLRIHKLYGKDVISGILQFFPDGKINTCGHNAIGNYSYYRNAPLSTGVLQPRSALFIQGSAMLMETKTARMGFWEEYKLYYDDVDFCNYCRNNGSKLVLIPSVSVIHREHSANKIEPRPDKGKEIYSSFWGTSNLA